MDRNEAINKRQTFYDDPRGCRNGHTPARRYVSTRNCWQCAQQQNVFKPVRVYLKEDQKDVFYALAQQLGWEIVQSGRLLPMITEHEDVNGKIPYV